MCSHPLTLQRDNQWTRSYEARIELLPTSVMVQKLTFSSFQYLASHGLIESIKVNTGHPGHYHYSPVPVCWQQSSVSHNKPPPLRLHLTGSPLFVTQFNLFPAATGKNLESTKHLNITFMTSHISYLGRVIKLLRVWILRLWPGTEVAICGYNSVNTWRDDSVMRDSHQQWFISSQIFLTGIFSQSSWQWRVRQVCKLDLDSGLAGIFYQMHELWGWGELITTYQRHLPAVVTVTGLSTDLTKYRKWTDLYF